MARVARVAGDVDLARLLAALDDKSAAELVATGARVVRARRVVLDAVHAAELDAVLCPAFATPAIPHGSSADLFLASSYSLVYSALGFCAGVVPVTRVHPSEARRDRARGRAGKAARRVDEQSAGLPVGVQVAAPPWHDQAALRVLAAIERNVRNDVDFPRTPVG
jgi:fatty acid amide hydrolase